MMTLKKHYSLTYHRRSVRGTHIIRWSAANMLWLRRHRTCVSCLPKTQWGEDHDTGPGWPHLGQHRRRYNYIRRSSRHLGCCLYGHRPPVTGGGGDVLLHQRWPRGTRTCRLRRPAAYSHTTATSTQVCSKPAPLKWADEDPDFDQTPPVWARLSEDVPAATKPWPPPPNRLRPPWLPNSQPTPFSAVDTYEITAQTDTSTDSRTEHAPADLFRTGMIWNKKLKVDKSSEKSQDRKRNRTRTPVSSKQKH